MRQTLVPLAGILLAAALGGCSEVYYYPLRHEGDFVYFEQASQQP
jgi:hypothetical protein